MTMSSRPPLKVLVSLHVYVPASVPDCLTCALGLPKKKGPSVQAARQQLTADVMCVKQLLQPAALADFLRAQPFPVLRTRCQYCSSFAHDSMLFCLLASHILSFLASCFLIAFSCVGSHFAHFLLLSPIFGTVNVFASLKLVVFTPNFLHFVPLTKPSCNSPTFRLNGQLFIDRGGMLSHMHSARPRVSNLPGIFIVARLPCFCWRI